MDNTKLKELFIFEYMETVQKLHPGSELAEYALERFQRFEVGGPERYQKPTERPNQSIPAWLLSTFRRGKGPTIGNTYKGLLCHKVPIDLVLYSALMWELKPKTIIELGSFHGGSGLWLADQMDSICGGGEVHSFDLYRDCVSPRAKHPRLYFHQADLTKLETLDLDLLKKLPHPWIIIDDAHVNMLNVLLFMKELMHSGDYFIKEDLDLMGSVSQIAEGMKVAEAYGLLVDSIYADAFGTNYTTAQNAWWVKI